MRAPMSRSPNFRRSASAAGDRTPPPRDNADALAATPGIDALSLGPADLSIALTNGADVDPMSSEVDRELDRIIAAARKAGKVMGAYCHSAESAVALAKRGVRFLAVGSDMGFLRAGAAAALKVLKG